MRSFTTGRGTGNFWCWYSFELVTDRSSFGRMTSHIREVDLLFSLLTKNLFQITNFTLSRIVCGRLPKCCFVFSFVSRISSFSFFAFFASCMLFRQATYNFNNIQRETKEGLLCQHKTLTMLGFWKRTTLFLVNHGSWVRVGATGHLDSSPAHFVH